MSYTPVSYTHLDVYKRQPILFFTLCFRILFDLPACELIAQIVHFIIRMSFDLVPFNDMILSGV